MARRTRSTFRRRAAARPRTTSRTTTRTTTTTVASRRGGAAKYILPAVLVGALAFFVARRVLAAPPPVQPPVQPPVFPPPTPPQQGTVVADVPVPNYPAGTVQDIVRAKSAGNIRGAPDVRSRAIEAYPMGQQLTTLNFNDQQNLNSAEAPQGCFAVKNETTGRTGWAAIHRFEYVGPRAAQAFAPNTGYAFVPYGCGYRHYGR